MDRRGEEPPEGRRALIPGAPAGAHRHDAERSLADLVAGGLLDADLAGLAWALPDLGIGVLVASPDGPAGESWSAATALAMALADAAALSGVVVHLNAGSDPAPVAAAVASAPGRCVLTAPDLGGTGSGALRRAAARAAIAAVSDRPGLALVATTGGADLETVADRLRGLTVAAPEDEIVRLGAVLVVGQAGGAGSARVVAAHYLRPPAIGPGGRVERRGPAVLATWDPAVGAWDHFAWGIVPEVAERAGVRPADLEAAVSLRAETIAALVAHGLHGADAFRAAAGLALPARPA